MNSMAFEVGKIKLIFIKEKTIKVDTDGKNDGVAVICLNAPTL